MVRTSNLKINLTFLAKLQNTGPLIYIPLNNNSIHCHILRSTKDSDHIFKYRVMFEKSLAVIKVLFLV